MKFKVKASGLSAPIVAVLLTACSTSKDGVSTDGAGSSSSSGSGNGSSSGSSGAPVLDKSCAIATGRANMATGGNAVLFSASDCSGNPLTALGESAFAITVDDVQLSTEGSAALVSQPPITPFVLVTLDVSASVGLSVPFADLLSGVADLVDRLHGLLPAARVGVAMLDAKGIKIIQEPTVDTAELKERISHVSLGAFDTSATDIYGGLVSLASADASYRGVYEAMNSGNGPLSSGPFSPGATLVGGVFTRGFLVLISDGKDTSALKTVVEARASLAADTQTSLLVAGIPSPDYDKSVVEQLAGFAYNVVTISPSTLSADLATIGNRIFSLTQADYVEWLCLPKQVGENAVAISVVAPQTVAARFSLPAQPSPASCYSSFGTQRTIHACGAILAGACPDGQFCRRTTQQCQPFLVRPGDEFRACVAISACAVLGADATAAYHDPVQCMYNLVDSMATPFWGSAPSIDFDEIRCLSAAAVAADCNAARLCIPKCPAGHVDGDQWCAGGDGRSCANGLELHYPCQALSGTCTLTKSGNACQGEPVGTCSPTCAPSGAAITCGSQTTALTQPCDSIEFSSCVVGGMPLPPGLACGVVGGTSMGNFATCQGGVLRGNNATFDCIAAGFSGCVDYNTNPIAGGTHCVP